MITTSLDEYVSKAMHRIEILCNSYNENEVVISFSGGMDSTVVLWLCKQCYELGTISYLPKAIFSDTGLELQATKDFVQEIQKYYPNIEIIKPEKSFVQCQKEYGKPMISKVKSQLIESYQSAKNEARKESSKNNLIYGKSNLESEKTTAKFKLANKDIHILNPEFDIKVSDKCCYVLKKKPFEKYYLENGIKAFFDGEMADEGGIRQTAYEKRIKAGGKGCTVVKCIGTGENKRIIEKKMPIIDWTKEIEQEYISKYNVPISKAYTLYGCKRTGCFLCPYSKNRKDVTEKIKILFDYEPKTYKYAISTMKDVYIAMNVSLPFDTEYENEREIAWASKYHKMNHEMMKLYRPSKVKGSAYQFTIFDYM
jgi:3'-phosphoadenosine 5'-phosphosulfate sulfotransferase (PAPS reductase)/FAD synthetase